MATDYGIDVDAGKDTVYFRSTARLEFIEGKTNNLIGGFSIDPDKPGEKATGFLRVDLRTLISGIGTRDEHMRDRHLHTKEFPYAFFAIDSLAGMPAGIDSSQHYDVVAFGRFYIHGFYRQMSADLSFDRSTGSAGQQIINARVEFKLRLDDYKIPRPKVLFLKLAETIEVELVFSGHSNLTPTKVSLPDWPQRR